MIYHSYCAILPKYLSNEEVEYIHGYARSLPIQEGRLGTGVSDTDSYQSRNTDKTGHGDNQIRQSTNKWIDHNDEKFRIDLKQKIFDGMVQANQESGWNYEITDMEHWQYTVYEAQPDKKTGDFYTWHTDSSADPYPAGDIRKISCSVQLSDPDDYEGGHFHISGLRYETKKGSAIIFPSNFMFPHEVNRIEKGTRYSIVTWLM